MEGGEWRKEGEGRREEGEGRREEGEGWREENGRRREEGGEGRSKVEGMAVRITSTSQLNAKHQGRINVARFTSDVL